MATIRSLISEYAYPGLEYYLKKVDEGGTETVINGVPVMEDAFVRGHVIRAAGDLYLYYAGNDDPKAADALRMLHRFISFLEDFHLESWGKLQLLRGFMALKKAGRLPALSEKEELLVRTSTDYDDFYDKETGLLKHGLPTNYYMVAMNCAGYREALGWEAAGMYDTISSIFFEKLQQGTVNGNMDEDPPYGRFDDYTFVIASEIVEALLDYGKPVPEFVLKNLSSIADLCLFMANKNGDGVNYGRSISVHGDSSVHEVFSAAAAAGLILPENVPLALSYCQAVIEKLKNFWDDPELHGINLWTKGRTTNQYRNISRLVEVNVDICEHLLTTLRNFEMAGLADMEITDCIPSPKTWQVREVLWQDGDYGRHETFFLRRGDDLLSLPLIGLGNHYFSTGYMPFPALCREIEAPSEAFFPFMVPEYTDEQDLVCRPVQFYKHIVLSEEKDRIMITAAGILSKYHLESLYPKKTPHRFKATWVFDGPEITATFETDLSQGKDVTMITGSTDERCTVLPFGFTHTDDFPTYGAHFYDTPHGALKNVKRAVGSALDTVGYRLLLPTQATLSGEK